MLPSDNDVCFKTRALIGFWYILNDVAVISKPDSSDRKIRLPKMSGKSSKDTSQRIYSWKLSFVEVWLQYYHLYEFQDVFLRYVFESIGTENRQLNENRGKTAGNKWLYWVTQRKIRLSFQTRNKGDNWNQFFDMTTQYTLHTCNSLQYFF